MAIFVTGDVHGGAEYGSSRFSSKTVSYTHLTLPTNSRV